MKRLVLILASAGFAAAGLAPSHAQSFAPNSFENLAHTFTAADMNDDGMMSSTEFLLLRNNMVDRNWIRTYRGDAFERTVPTVVRSFSQLDRDDNGTISRTEFMNIANNPLHRRTHMDNEDHWDWDPEFMTVSYYLMVNPIDTDHFRGRDVVNLSGEEIGTIHAIARTANSNEHYAVVRVADKTADPTPTQLRARTVGIPLEDLLLSTEGASLMLSQRGEEYLLDDQGRQRVKVENLRPVDRIYGV